MAETSAMLALGLYLAVVNAAAFLAYGWDKQQAVRRGWRVSEQTLLTLAAIGGSPAAFAAQRLFRHKVSKRPFQRAFWAIVAVQVAFVALWPWRAEVTGALEPLLAG